MIYEKDDVGENDKVEIRSVSIKDNKIEMSWEVVYTKDTDDVESAAEEAEKGYTLPEYIFEIEQSQVSKKVESTELEVKGWIYAQMHDEASGKPLADRDYVIYLTDDSEIKGTTDSEGYVKEDELGMGKYFMVLK